MQNGPYKDAEQIDELRKKNDDDGLNKLRKEYMEYFEKNQCELINDGGWAILGAKFLDLAIEGAHGKEQTLEEFTQMVGGSLKLPVPSWIKKVKYVQTGDDGVYYLALPPRELARQARLHTLNPKTVADKDYVKPPIYKDFTAEAKGDAELVLNTRICDYVISHCG